jgi:glucose uptake protein GlcU
MSTAALQLLTTSESNVGLAWALCLASGVLGGTYPIMIKVPRVIAAKVHPIVFQCYKSFWVFALGWIFLFVNWLRHKPALAFSCWAAVCASMWVPSGFCYIAAVPRCGVATTTIINKGVICALEFLISILLLDEEMKRYGTAQVPLAPFYLLALVLGMIGLVLSPSLSLKCLDGNVDSAECKDLETRTNSTMSLGPEGDSFGPGDDSVLLAKAAREDRRDFVVGVLLAIAGGVFTAMQFAVSGIGKQVELASGTAPDLIQSEFGAFDSYMMNFGVGCAVFTPVLFLAFTLLQKGRGKALPSAEFQVMKLYGFLAGALWFGQHMCSLAAVNVGGLGSFGPANSACGLIVTGIWGILYYREVKSPRRIACWGLSAAWTITFVLLLSGELTSKPEAEHESSSQFL